MPKFDNLPQFFEELKLKEDATLSLSELIANFKQQIPANFICLEIKEKNFQCSTTGWKEPVCERYGFDYKGEWKQIDIPHSLLEKLGLKKGENLPTSFYLEPNLLKKELICGGVTIQEGEIVLVNPNKLIVKDQANQTDLSSNKIKELENTIAEQTKKIQAKDQELAGLRSQLNAANTQKLTTDEQNAITWTQICITAMNNDLTNMNTTSHLDSYQSYFNPGGVFSSSVAGGLAKYGRMYNVITNLVNAWNQTRTQINARNSSANSYKSQIDSLTSQVNNLNNQLTTIRNQLEEREKWGTKWECDPEPLFVRDSSNPKVIKMLFPRKVTSPIFPNIELTDENGEFILNGFTSGVLKHVVYDIYLYFRDKPYKDIYSDPDYFRKDT
jgi:prefoldin subunit 5